MVAGDEHFMLILRTSQRAFLVCFPPVSNVPISLMSDFKKRIGSFAYSIQKKITFILIHKIFQIITNKALDILK